MINLNPNPFLDAGIWRVTKVQAGPPQKTKQKNKTQIRNVYEI
jgi:hypothetical protein